MKRFDVAEESAITRVLVDYCWALDEQDWGLMDQVFTADATLTASSGEYEGAASIIDLMSTSRTRFVRTQHLLSNVRVIPTAVDAADVTSYVLGHDVEPGEPEALVRIAAVYRDRVVKADGHWRIAHRTISRVWLDPH